MQPKQVHSVTLECVRNRGIDGASYEIARRLMGYLRAALPDDGFSRVEVTFAERVCVCGNNRLPGAVGHLPTCPARMETGANATAPPAGEEE